MPLRWTNAASYYLPFGKGKMLFTNADKWTDLAIGGWQLNFTNVYQTGFPLTIYQSTNNNSILGTGVQRPNAAGVSRCCNLAALLFLDMMDGTKFVSVWYRANQQLVTQERKCLLP